MRSKYVLWGLRVAGAGLLAATAAIHLDLYLTGYRSIPTIGWLFLLQVITAFALALAVLIVPLVPLKRPSADAVDAGVAAAGAGFALATLGGYLLSLWVGLFGFKEIRTTAGIVAGVVEVAAFAALAAFTVAPAAPVQQARPAARDSGLLARAHDGLPGAGRAVAGMSVAALVLLGVL